MKWRNCVKSLNAGETSFRKQRLRELFGVEGLQIVRLFAEVGVT